MATYYGHVPMVRFLIAHGADATVRDDEGLTPREYAALKGHAEVMQILNARSRIVQFLVFPFLIVRFSKQIHAVGTLLLLALLHNINLIQLGNNPGVHNYENHVPALPRGYHDFRARWPRKTHDHGLTKMAGSCVSGVCTRRIVRNAGVYMALVVIRLHRGPTR